MQWKTGIFELQLQSSSNFRRDLSLLDWNEWATSSSAFWLYIGINRKFESFGAVLHYLLLQPGESKRADDLGWEFRRLTRNKGRCRGDGLIFNIERDVGGWAQRLGDSHKEKVPEKGMDAGTRSSGTQNRRERLPKDIPRRKTGGGYTSRIFPRKKGSLSIKWDTWRGPWSAGDVVDEKVPPISLEKDRSFWSPPSLLGPFPSSEPT